MEEKKKEEKNKLKKLIKLFLQKSLKLDEENLGTNDLLENSGITNRELYGLQVKIGFGYGTPADTPYIVFLNYNQKTQNGIYPALLFYRRLKGISNLIVAYGVSENQKPTLEWQIENKPTVREVFKKHLKKLQGIHYLDSFVEKSFKVEKEDDINDELLEEIADSLENVIKCFHSQFKKRLFKDLVLEPALERAFYNALRTKPFVILAGPSGTGKSKIAENLSRLFKLCALQTQEGEFLLYGNCSKLQSLAENINNYFNSKSSKGRKNEQFVKIGGYFLPLRALGYKENKTTEQCKSIAKNYGLEIFSHEKEVQNLEELKKSVKINSDLNFLYLPIKPEFRDSTSLLGFYNPLIREYQTTHLLEFILRASENYLRKGNNANPFIVLLDELNLARVEYYFSDFLSILETKKFASWEEASLNPRFKEFLETLQVKEIDENAYLFSSQGIKLHSQKLENQQVPQELFLPPNLYFVGTINIDETTHPLSPKVLDRSFVLEFEVGSFKTYLQYLNKTLQIEQKKDFDRGELEKDFTRSGKFAIIDKKEIKEYCLNNENIVQFLEEINNILKHYGFHFGYRVFDEIISFISNAQSSIIEMSYSEALDFALKSKVLPKLNGVRQRLEKPIKELLNKLLSEPLQLENIDSLPWFECKTLKVKLEKDETKEVLEKEVKTDYPQTVAKLLEMFYRLKTEGFASFI